MEPKWRERVSEVADVAVHPREREQVARIRSYKIEQGGKTYRIYRGDLHRHTDISVDGMGDGSLMAFHYTGQGFVPVAIEPKVVKDVSAITFLGTALVEKFPVIKTWQVPPHSNVDDEKHVVAKGPYIPLNAIGLESSYPVLQGYKDYVAQKERAFRKTLVAQQGKAEGKK